MEVKKLLLSIVLLSCMIVAKGQMVRLDSVVAETPPPFGKGIRKLVYSYDDCGRLLSCHAYKGKEKLVPVSRCECSYDEHGWMKEIEKAYFDDKGLITKRYMRNIARDANHEITTVSDYEQTGGDKVLCSTMRYSVSPDGRKKEVHTEEYLDGKHLFDSRLVYELDNGNVVRATFSNCNDSIGEWHSVSKSEHKYDNKGRKIWYALYYPNNENASNDADWHLHESVATVYDDSINCWIQKVRHPLQNGCEYGTDNVFHADKDGNRLCKQTYSSSAPNGLLSQTCYFYDKSMAASQVAGIDMSEIGYSYVQFPAEELKASAIVLTRKIAFSAKGELQESICYYFSECK